MIRTSAAILVPTALIVAVLIVYKDTITQAFVQTPQPVETKKIVVGKILVLQGHVKSWDHKSQKYLKTEVGNIYHNDSIITGGNASFIIGFSSNAYEIRVLPKSRVRISTWDPEKLTGPALIHLEAGNYDIVKKGQPGQLYILSAGEMFIPSRRPNREKWVKSDRAPWKIGQIIRSKETESEDVQPPQPIKNSEPNSQETETPQDSAGMGTGVIENIIASERSGFRKCQSKSLRENKESKGRLLIGFIISPTGKIKDVRTLESSFKDEQLPSCIQDVFARLRFKAFDGEPIYFSYPMTFE